MLPQCFVGRMFEAPNLNIACNVAVPHPGAQFRHFFFGEICNGAFNFLHGAHVETLAEPAACTSRSFSWLTLQMSHAHPKSGRCFERGGDEKKRTNGERWLWRLVRLFFHPKSRDQKPLGWIARTDFFHQLIVQE